MKDFDILIILVVRWLCPCSVHDTDKISLYLLLGVTT